MSPSARLVLALALGFVLVVAGYGSTAVAQQWNQECHEKWDDRDATADCEDAFHVVMVYGGALVGTLGVALLGAAGWTYGSRPDG